MFRTFTFSFEEVCPDKQVLMGYLQAPTEESYLPVSGIVEKVFSQLRHTKEIIGGYRILPCEALDVKAGVVNWPMSVIRLNGPDSDRIIALADVILEKWRGYTDEAAFIYAETDGEPHNTITPIARKRGDNYELDLVLRNNITTEEHPLGVYHPHAKLHHIKKENIGLIEVMGLAVLPSRLDGEMAALE